MKRKHSPGCYCCQNNEPCPECCDPEEIIPSSLNPSPGDPDLWTRIGREYDDSCCCLREIWVHNDPDPVYSCCQLIKYDKWTTNDHRIDHNLILPPVFFKRMFGQCRPGLCPEDETDCCVQGDYKLGEWNHEVTAIMTHYFAVDFYLDSMAISWAREEIRCPDPNPNDDILEPKCRYVMKIAVRGHYEARINTNLKITSVAENIYHDVCNNVSENCTPGIPNCTIEAESCDHPEFTCVTTRDNENCSNTDSNCAYEFGEFCWERIKYFDAAPENLITFGSTDVIEEDPFDPNTDCDEPICRVDCPSFGGYFTSILVESPASFAPPCWCENPPTIETYTVSNVLDFSWCTGPENDDQWNYLSRFCCGESPDLVRRCDPVVCDNPITIVTSCDRVLWNYCTPGEGCQFTSAFPPWNSDFNTNTRLDCESFPPPGTKNVGAGTWNGQLNWYSCFAGFFPGYTGPCPPANTPANCCSLLICPDPDDPGCTGECGCIPKTYPAAFVKSLTTTVDIDCQAYQVKQCLYQIPDWVVRIENE